MADEAMKSAAHQALELPELLHRIFWHLSIPPDPDGLASRHHHCRSGVDLCIAACVNQFWFQRAVRLIWRVCSPEVLVNVKDKKRQAFYASLIRSFRIDDTQASTLVALKSREFPMLDEIVVDTGSRSMQTLAPELSCLFRPSLRSFYVRGGLHFIPPEYWDGLWTCSQSLETIKMQIRALEAPGGPEAEVNGRVILMDSDSPLTTLWDVLSSDVCRNLRQLRLGTRYRREMDKRAIDAIFSSKRLAKLHFDFPALLNAPYLWEKMTELCDSRRLNLHSFGTQLGTFQVPRLRSVLPDIPHLSLMIVGPSAGAIASVAAFSNLTKLKLAILARNFQGTGDRFNAKPSGTGCFPQPVFTLRELKVLCEGAPRLSTLKLIFAAGQDDYGRFAFQITDALLADSIARLYDLRILEIRAGMRHPEWYYGYSDVDEREIDTSVHSLVELGVGCPKLERLKLNYKSTIVPGADVFTDGRRNALHGRVLFPSLRIIVLPYYNDMDTPFLAPKEANFLVSQAPRLECLSCQPYENILYTSRNGRRDWHLLEGGHDYIPCPDDSSDSDGEYEDDFPH